MAYMCLPISPTASNAKSWPGSPFCCVWQSCRNELTMFGDSWGQTMVRAATHLAIEWKACLCSEADKLAADDGMALPGTEDIFVACLLLYITDVNFYQKKRRNLVIRYKIQTWQDFLTAKMKTIAIESMLTSPNRFWLPDFYNEWINKVYFREVH